MESQEIVSEMVYSFLLPQVMREAQQRKVNLAQKKHLLAAHNTIHREGESVIKSVSRDASIESDKQKKDTSTEVNDPDAPGPSNAPGAPPTALGSDPT